MTELDDTSDLDDTQRWVTATLRSRTALPKDAECAARAADLFTGNERLSPVEQLEIYREQFWLRHTAALLEDFPGLSGILGQTEWEQLVESYLTERFPKSWTLRDLGCNLPEHVARRSETPHHSLCIDMARLEWLYVEIFDAPDAPPFDADKLARIEQAAWPTARIVLNPALRLLQVSYPVAELRNELVKQQSTQPMPSKVTLPEKRAEHLVLYRDTHRDVACTSIDETAFLLLRALHDGLRLIPACECVIQHNPAATQEIETRLQTWFHDWTTLDWIVDVEVEPSNPIAAPALSAC